MVCVSTVFDAGGDVRNAGIERSSRGRVNVRRDVRPLKKHQDWQKDREEVSMQGGHKNNYDVHSKSGRQDGRRCGNDHGDCSGVCRRCNTCVKQPISKHLAQFSGIPSV